MIQNLEILVIDDGKNICRSLKMILSSEGYRVRTAETAHDGRGEIRKKEPDIILLDVMLPDTDGLKFLTEIRGEYPGIEVIMISGHATLSMAVQATRAGAFDFLEKPLQKEKVLITLDHLSEKRQLQNQYRVWQEEKLNEYRMIGESPVLQRVITQIQKVAPTESKVLIRGESGTGKELVAWAIHHQSLRQSGPFVKMNCAAIPEELTESELFGHEKGAFTGASQTRDGKFQQADGGTLFLDEIADMSLRVQTKVLRVLQDGVFERVGGSEPRQVNVRVIAATNRNLEELVKTGNFREDLYYRLNVFPIEVPALRERREDVPLLVAHFLQKYCLKNNRRLLPVDVDVITVLQKYHWPGNIRELQNLVERLIILNSGKMITVVDLPVHLLETEKFPSPLPAGEVSLKKRRYSAERDHILSCLDKSGWNVSKAARMMGVERSNLHKKMKVLGIRRGEG